MTDVHVEEKALTINDNEPEIESPRNDAGTTSVIVDVPVSPTDEHTASTSQVAGTEETASPKSDVLTALQGAGAQVGHAAQVAGTYISKKGREAATAVSTTALPALNNAGTFLASKSRAALAALGNFRRTSRSESQVDDAHDGSSASPNAMINVPLEEEPSIVIAADSDDDTAVPKPVRSEPEHAEVAGKSDDKLHRIIDQARAGVTHAGEVTKAGLITAGTKTAQAARTVSASVKPALSNAAKVVHESTVSAGTVIAAKARGAAEVVAPAVQNAARAVADSTSNAARSIASGSSKLVRNVGTKAVVANVERAIDS